MDDLDAYRKVMMDFEDETLASLSPDEAERVRAARRAYGEAMDAARAEIAAVAARTAERSQAWGRAWEDALVAAQRFTKPG